MCSKTQTTSTALCLLLLMTACNRQPSQLPAAGSKEYRDLCSSFYLGLAALQSGEDVRARSGLKRATEIAPGEPAGWVDLGLLDARQQEFDAAYANFDKARTLAPDNSRIENFLGLVESKRGKIAEALAHYRKAASLDHENLRARYSLAIETERQQNPGSDTDGAKLLEEVLKLRPQNVPVLLDMIRIAGKLQDSTRLQSSVTALAASAASWPEPAKQQWTRLQDAAKTSDFRASTIQAQFLRNTLLRTPSFRNNLDEIRVPDTAVGEPFLTFLKLPSPTSEPAAPDIQTRFEPETLQGAPAQAAGLRWIGAIPLDAESRPAIVWANASGIQSETGAAIPLSPNAGVPAVLGVDLNYDFKVDLVVATRQGIRFYRQDTPKNFQDVTAESKLPSAILQGSYTGAWAFDFDLDGDLDLMLGVPTGEPVVLRNNADASFAALKPFQGVTGVTAFSTADLDSDGVPDVGLVDASGRLVVFGNERLGSYKKLNPPTEVAVQNVAISAGDVDGNGRVDFVLLRNDRSIARLSIRNDRSWDIAQIATGTGAAVPKLLLADLDNNGALDIVAGDRILLNDGKKFEPLQARLPAPAWSVADVNQDGRLDVISLSSIATPISYANKGTKDYHWQIIRTRAATVMGDQRINSFGIGGEIEIRSGLLTQKQMLTSPLLHFGLGEHPGVEFARIVWPNGLVQAEFALQANQSVLAQQRLKGSCPFLFTWDGKQMRFLKDVAPMSAPLGAHLDGDSLEKIIQTEQWFKIDGSHLAPRDGYYDLRLTNEYWETYYIDRYSLWTVDHPQGSFIHVDERVADPPAPLAIYVTAEPRPFASAHDHTGRDVSTVVRNLDAKYLDGFGVGQYQGLTRDHWVELELPAEAPQTGPLYLIGDGFLHPWDDTITMARSQGSGPHPEDLSIEVPGAAAGQWVKAKAHLGIPAGRLKAVVIDLAGIFRPGSPRKLRLRTTMEVYWDKLRWAVGVPNTTKTQTLQMSAADLRYRGFSLLTQANGGSSPELANYDVLAQTGQQWRNLEGYYTRYGDVRELLQKVDDRMVIVASGDELRMRFPVDTASQPKPGWVRDFFFAGNGWLKEGDYNYRYSKTVLPLPYGGMRTYTAPLLPLEQDPAYLRNPLDWQRFHTRYVTFEPFTRALWANRN
jgi:Tfp pilus assembly protein PilF